ncbi:hypothetical protein RI103_20055 [Paraburkholderia sp. FT54]|uniref:hypothetical protein n=1 Tax=Paraburkholderia sp. FT54 TaxID=3074437 RepID=UPI002878122E|nr:hypothetical protein [Paraburkholderia sp. FT54]WNC93133.1 hypothetical protein RI103_20055 [Paraburkholderia sp. FT54]
MGKSYGWLIASGLAALSLFASIFAILLSILTIWRNWSIARVNLVANCHKTYGDIFSELFELNEEAKMQGPVPAGLPGTANPPAVDPMPVIKRRAHKLLLRLWNLQHEQYLYFREELIPQPVFESWLIYRYADYRSTDYNFDGIGYKWTWDTRKREFAHQSDFVELMDLAMDTANKHSNAADAASLAVQDAMYLYKRSTAGSNIRRHWSRIADFYKH